MKKIYSLVAIAGLVFATACSDENYTENIGGESVVNFTAELPSALTTSRADFGDGTTATTLSYAIYEAGEKTPLIVGNDAVTFTGLKASFSASLVNGRSYDVIFWADAPNSIYTFDAATQSITANYAKANQESYDAFFAAVKGMAVNGAAQQPVELYRPFAQLNIGTNDTQDATTAGLAVTETQIAVKAYTTLNLYTGEVSNESNLTYAMSAIPTDDDYPVAGYDYLGLNYILVPADATTYDVTFTTYEGQAAVNTRTYSTVPLQRNYKTNIYGRLLTSTTDFNVEIKPAFLKTDKDYELPSADTKSLKEMIAEVSDQENAVVYLGDNAIWNVSDLLLATDNTTTKTLTIIGNGNKITATGLGSKTFEAGNGAKVIFKNVVIVDDTYYYSENGETAWEFCYLEFGGDMEFENCVFDYNVLFATNTLKVTNCVFNNKGTNPNNLTNEYAAWIYNGEATFTGCSFNGPYRGLKIGDMYSGSDVTSVVIDGCTFKDLSKKPGIAIDENIGATMAVTIKNSTFKNVQPGDQGLYIYETDNVVPTLENNTVITINTDGSMSDNEGNYYVETQEQLSNVLKNANGKTVYLGEGTFNATNIPMPATGSTVVIEGDGENTVFNYSTQGYNQYVSGNSGNYVFKNMVINRSNETFAGMAHTNSTRYENCIINGAYFVYETTAEFIECTFNQTGNNYNCWLYGTTSATYTDCTFNCDGKSIYVDGSRPNSINVKFTGCTFNDINKVVTDKAAIETGTTYGTSYSLIIDETTVNGFNINPTGTNTGTTLWANKHSMGTDKLNVVVDGVDVY